MTDTQKQAIDTIRNATGWNAQPFVNGAQTESNDGPRMSVFWSEFYGSWCCQVTLVVSWISHGDTPEVVIADVLPRYRAHIAALAADILPEWPRLEWRPSAGKDYALVYRHEGLTFPMYRVFASSLPDDYGAESLTGGTSTYGSLDFVLAEIAAHCASRIPSLRLPPFPEITHVS